jgi:hypothetical protein
MPRLQPAAGYITAKEAMSILDVSDATLHYYVSTGKLRRYGPPERKHKFYKLSEVEALKTSRNVFAAEYRSGDWRENPASSFELAKTEDIPTIARIDHDAIHPGDDDYNEEFFLRWQQRNPETLFALRNADGLVVGFASILPVNHPILDGFLRGDFSITNIADEDIPLYTAGATVHLYIVAVATDPQIQAKIRHEYGFALLTGVLSFVRSLADRGVTIETITARSHTQDGIKLMRKLGLPWLISPDPEMQLFSVRVAESGMPFLRDYCTRLEQWKQEHQMKGDANVSNATKRARKRN